MSEFSKAPWKVDKNGALEDSEGIKSVCIFGEEGDGFGRVAMAYAEVGREEELLPNAHLIAAAPDMHDALESFILTVEDGGDLVDAHNQARSALKKARGE